MNTESLTLLSEETVKQYKLNNHLYRHETSIVNEILQAFTNNDNTLIEWFSSFGPTPRHIIMNVYAYRRGLDFGFSAIALDKHGWFQRPMFLEKEILKFGLDGNYGTYSEITVGRGSNYVWTYALSYSFGCAGGGSAISVYDKPFQSRQDALNFALKDLKDLMAAKVGNSDTTNFKQSIILATLKAIDEFKYTSTQLSLF